MVIPVLISLMLLSAVAAYLLRSRGMRLAYIWLILTAVAFSIWLILLVIPIDRFSSFKIGEWFQVADETVSLTFSVDSFTWEFAFSVATILLTYLLTSVARLEPSGNLRNWIIVIIFMAAAVFAFTSTSLWSLILAWTAFDMIFIIYQLILAKNRDLASLFKESIFKFFGSLLLIWATAFYSQGGYNPMVNTLPARAGIPLIFAAFLHSGAIPIIPSYRFRNHSDQMIDTIFRIVGFALSFSFIANLPGPELPIILRTGFLFLSLAFMLVFSLQWYRSNKFIYAVQYLLLAGTEIFFTLYLTGAGETIKYWQLFFMLPLIWLVCYSHRSKVLAIFSSLVILSLSGLPLTLLTYGVRNIPFERFSIPLIGFLISHMMITAGFIRQTFKDKLRYEQLDTWYQAIYSIGLFIPIFAVSAGVFKNLGSIMDELSFWWVGLAVLVPSIFLSVVIKSWLEKQKTQRKDEENQKQIPEIFLSFNWLFHVIPIIESRIKNLVLGFSGLLEGDGGILWSFVLIILLISIFWMR